MSRLLDAALEYAAKGWPVFPCNAQKKPMISREDGGQGVLDATTNKKKIREWWERWPKANIGLDVAGAGMMVLDLDPGHDLAELAENIGKLPKTQLRQRTPRGGEHLFFDLAEGDVVPPSSSKVARFVDVRSFHSYVLLEPSRTRDGSYTWESEGKPAFRTDKMVEAASAGGRSKSEDRDTWTIEPDLEENIALCTEWLKTKAAIAIEGDGGDHMAYSTAAMCKSYGLSPETALDLMWEYWNPRCHPPWSPDEIDHLEEKVRNGYAYNTSPPGNMTPAYKVAKSQAMFKPISRETTEGGREVQAGRFRIVDRGGMDEIKPPAWLIKDAIPENSYSMLIGARGTFKTFIALDMALSVATGAAKYFDDDEPWLGLWPDVAAPGPVLYVAGEGRSGIRSRVRAWEHHHLDGDRATNLCLSDPVPGPNETDVTEFIETALEMSPTGYRFIVLDTVGRAMQGLNENSQQDASMFTRMVEAFQRELGAAVLAIHHSGHGEVTRGRGSTVFPADVDAEFLLQRDGKDTVVQLLNTKQKEAPEWEQAKLVQLRPIKLADKEKSLTAVSPSKKIEQARKEQEPQTAKDGKRGRKTVQEKQQEMSVIRKAAYQALKSYPGREFTANQLSYAIAQHDQVSIGAQAIRKHYLESLLSDKEHPVVRCYDAGKMRWVYRP